MVFVRKLKIWQIDSTFRDRDSGLIKSINFIILNYHKI